MHILSTVKKSQADVYQANCCLKKRMKVYISTGYLLIILILPFACCGQLADTLRYKSPKKKFTRTELFIPSILISSSLISFTDNEVLDNEEFLEARNSDLPRFHSSIDDYLQYAPASILFGAELLGEKGENDLLNQTILLVKSEIIMNVIVQPLKRITHVERPDGSSHYSFPSGHTAEAFLAAEFLNKELGDKSICYSIAGYSIATSVGLLRMANNKHWASDVLAGAAIGIFSVDVAYKTHQYRWKKKSKTNLSFISSYSNGEPLLMLNLSF